MIQIWVPATHMVMALGFDLVQPQQLQAFREMYQLMEDLFLSVSAFQIK